jgi:hypothetical protein
MAMIFEVVYPGGERATAVGHPGGILRVAVVPRGPEACFGDRVEADCGGRDAPARVRRVVGGPRCPTLHVRVSGDREAWMDAREAEGWATHPADDDPAVVWLVALSDGLRIEPLLGGEATLVLPTP